ncbi:MAG: protein kinase [Simkaniaceae bacterium]|nr:protein kinase [Simkaniaceae bacterium]
MGSEESVDKIGRYDVIRKIGKGGMGEIYLVRDPVCGRDVALKKILPKLIRYPVIKERFLNEAKIAARLSHPSIIPIHSLQDDDETIYYTMPHIEGETLQEIIKKTRALEKEGGKPHPIGSSIPALIRLFFNVCQAMHYAHTRGVLHRDLKPENMIVGRFGEVIILDWGIAATPTSTADREEDVTVSDPGPPESGAGGSVPSSELTRPGKVVGTVGYMAPERALGADADVKTDIYALGVILYRLLTLKFPFVRPSLREFRKKMKFERWMDPEEAAPHRDIPAQLSEIARKCLTPSPEDRYDSVKEIVTRLEGYIEGCPEWAFAVALDMHRPEDWEFQENVLFTKQEAIAGPVNLSEWVMLMISKGSYSGNMRIETTLSLRSDCKGVGFLLCVPEATERKSVEEGYCIRLDIGAVASCTLFRSNVAVMHIPDVSIGSEADHAIVIEKVDNHLRFFIDKVPVLDYLSSFPLVGGHIGLLLPDARFVVGVVRIFFGSRNVMVNCLSIPDAFFTARDYDKALHEYRGIAYSFRGRAEGREALFRGGITLLEQAKGAESKEGRERLLSLAREEFEKLHGTPGGPLEYLGKSLVYGCEGEVDEEVKCLELAIRKYPKHPLLSAVEEHVHFRLHETAGTERRGVYAFLLLLLGYMPHTLESAETVKLIENIEGSWEPLYFMERLKEFSGDRSYGIYLASELAFRLSKPATLYEIVRKIFSPANGRDARHEEDVLMRNAFFAALEMGYPDMARMILKKIKEYGVRGGDRSDALSDRLIREAEKPITAPFVRPPYGATVDLSFREVRSASFSVRRGLTIRGAKERLPFFGELTREQMHPGLRLLAIRSFLLSGYGSRAEGLFPDETDFPPDSPYYSPYGCFLAKKRGHKRALRYFESSLDAGIPSGRYDLGLFLHGNMTWQSSRMEGILPFERLALLEMLTLYYVCAGKKRRASHFEQMAVKEREQARIPLRLPEDGVRD